MSLVLSHDTALQFWRRRNADTIRQMVSCGPAPLSDKPDSLTCKEPGIGKASSGINIRKHGKNTIESHADVATRAIAAHRQSNAHAFEAPTKALVDDARQVLGISYDVPVHVLVPDAKSRRSRPDMICHVCSNHIPGKHFAIAAPGILVSSPELCLLQAAETMPTIELLFTCFEFCGSFTLVRSLVSNELEIANRPPITTPAKLAAFAKKASRLRGARRLLKLSKYICADTESPKEAQLAMLLGLPYKYGGYSFGIPISNPKITPSGRTRLITAKSSFRYDLYWPKAKLCVEYDSRRYHTSEEKLEQDALRRNVIEYMGIRVITVTPKQIHSMHAMDGIAEQIRKALSKQDGRPATLYQQRKQELFDFIRTGISYGLPW